MAKASRFMRRANMKQSDKSTSTLFDRLFIASDLKDFINENEDIMQVPSFHEYIVQMCRNMGETQEHVIKRSAIERTYGHQLFNGTRRPSRDKVIQLSFGFGLDVEGTQKMLKVAQKSTLYPKIKRDAAIIYCISHKAGLIKTQTMLHDLRLTLLGGE
jgi:hypothetical protein